MFESLTIVGFDVELNKHQISIINSGICKFTNHHYLSYLATDYTDLFIANCIFTSAHLQIITFSHCFFSHRFSLMTQIYFLPIGSCLLLFAYCFLPITFLPIAFCLLHLAYCTLPIAPCLLQFAYCPLTFLGPLGCSGRISKLTV